ncbi:DUF4174 domain-containing protein [Algoriphagus lacus]|uniref:DUF4174 domain-containing protein n=1 Tax=Algoriphagus lacus TaxID=2056311 RepID=A0A418PRE4_9BACT|nr:DUF4174 domain-containing protein [Algoriphagus lacus]RIW15145.1 DUF4174 domain-containing protein [Algoriphagus lacus]
MNWIAWIVLFVSLQWIKTTEDFIWQNRIIIYSGKGDFSSWQSEARIQDLTDRKLLYFHFKDGKLLNSNYKGKVDEKSFLNKLGLEKNSSEKWVLVGLDGGIKKAGEDIPVLYDIFKTIDAMPMRQSEIKRRD